MRVLFVCSGNICRSPMAAELLRHRARATGLDDLEALSCGTLGIEAAPASVEAIEALREVGLDLTGHRSRGIGPDDVRSADLVVCMARRHLDELAVRFPRRSGGPRVLLRAFEHGPEPDVEAPDLDDPIGEELDVYREQREVISRCVEHLLEHLARAR